MIYRHTKGLSLTMIFLLFPLAAKAVVWEPSFGLRLNRAHLSGVSSPDVFGFQAGAYAPFYLNSQVALRTGIFLVTRDVELSESGQSIRFSRTVIDAPLHIYGILHPQFALFGGFNVGLKLASSGCNNCALRNERTLVLQPLLGGEYRTPNFSLGMGLELQTEYFDQFKQSAVVFQLGIPLSTFTEKSRAPASKSRTR